MKWKYISPKLKGGGGGRLNRFYPVSSLSLLFSFSWYVMLRGKKLLSLHYTVLIYLSKKSQNAAHPPPPQFVGVLGTCSNNMFFVLGAYDKNTKWQIWKNSCS